MKIAYFALSEEWNSNNAGHSHVFSICKNLAKLGHSVELFIRGKDKKIEEKNFKVNFVNFPKTSKLNIFEIQKEISKINSKIKDYDIIQERFSVNPLSILARKGFKGKVVLEVNDPGIETWKGIKKILYYPFIKLKFNSCNAIITQTKTLKNILETQTKKPIFVVSNGAELIKVKKKAILKARKEMNCKKNDVCILFVGSFRNWHGVHLIPKIAKNFKKNKKIKFSLIGTGELFSEVKEKSKTITNIKLLGAKPFEKIPEYLKAADILIAPFTWTKDWKKFDFWWSPLKLFEYLAAGKPIVSTNFKEIKEIVDGAALLVKHECEKDFSKKISILVNKKQLRTKLGKKAIKIAKKNTWEQKAKETIKVYEKVSE